MVSVTSIISLEKPLARSSEKPINLLPIEVYRNLNQENLQDSETLYQELFVLRVGPKIRKRRLSTNHYPTTSADSQGARRYLSVFVLLHINSTD